MYQQISIQYSCSFFYETIRDKKKNNTQNDLKKHL